MQNFNEIKFYFELNYLKSNIFFLLNGVLGFWGFGVLVFILFTLVMRLA